jgi:hypothetical protein
MTLTPGTVGTSGSGGVQFAQKIFSALVPAEGPRMVSYVADFPLAASFEVDMTLSQSQQYMSVVQTLFIDASQATAPVSVSVEGTKLTIELEAGSQGFFPLLVPTTGAKFLIASASTQPVTVIFVNVPIPANVWNVNGQPLNITGPLAPDAPASGVTPVSVAQAGGVVHWHSYSAATANPAASTALFPAVADGARLNVFIKAPESADLWVNRLGGTAAIDGIDCFKIPAGAIYENFPSESVSQAWTYYCAATAVNFTALTQDGN